MPKIFAELDELKKLAAAQEEEVEQEETTEEVVEEVTEEPEPEAKEEPNTEEPAKVEEEKPLDDSGFARLRREKAAAEKEAQRLRDELEELRKPKDQTEEQVEATPIAPELAEVVQEYRYQKAGLEFNALEDEFRKKNTDYDDVSNAYKQALAQSIRIQNPRMPIDSVIKEANRQLLIKASTYVQKGFDPIEEMYHEAKELGFSAKPKVVETEEKKELKPDLDKVAANRARNAGTASAKGSGTSGQLTMGAAATLTAKEWAALPKAEKDRILAGG